MPVAERVAIVSMAIRFPQAGTDPGRFWDLVASAGDASRDVPAERWVLPPDQAFEDGGPNPDRVYSTRGYYLDPFSIDASDTGFPAEFLSQLDPLFHLILDVGRRAWAGSQNGAIDPRRVGVVLGNICLPTERVSQLARDLLSLSDSPSTAHPLNRYVAGLPAGLLAKSLGLGGGTFTLDAACASSLYAFKLACDDLLAGRADAMLAGGANRADSLYTQMGFAQLRALSRSGRCSPFDAAADGLMVGEGAGIFVLKRLSDALKQGDKIHGIICGIGLSNDMHGNLLAPAREGQLRAMRQAYENAGWKPTYPDVIECHATGTAVGDAVEFESLRELWGSDGWQPGQCVIGSVKSSVGHLLTGAGAAAVAKILKAFAAQKKPPQANFNTPGPGLHYEGGPFRVLREAESWDVRRPTLPRRAAVSGFGFGGVNAHLLLEEYVGQTFVANGSKAVPVTATTRKQSTPNRAVPIAIVGMGAHFGPWETLRAFQEFTLGGNGSAPPTAKRNGWDLVPEDCPDGHFIEFLTARLDRFRIPPKELEEMLPQQLLMLEVAADALADSRSEVGSDDDPHTGVFIGLGLDLNTTNYHIRWAGLAAGDAEPRFPPLTADRTMGALGSIAASRIARAFRFGGPSFTVCSEESSAARAIELGVRALRAGEIDRAVVGGVDLAGDPRALLGTDADRPFDAEGKALPFSTHGKALGGEGAAAVVLKRLDDAERDGDRIYAVIRGVGTACGGKPAGLAPDAASYATSLVRACSDAVVDPSSADYLDLAATGTEADDRPEAEALAALLDAQKRPHPLTLSAVQGQVGQVGAAAAAAGLVKACLALHHRILPASLSHDGLRPEAVRVAERCHWSREPRAWLRDDDYPRRAIVAATGVDGSVVHIVLEEYGNIPSDFDPQPLGTRPEAVFLVEGNSVDDLLTGLATLTAWLDPRSDLAIERLAREWLTICPQMPDLRRAVSFVARSGSELLEQVATVSEALRMAPDAPFPAPGTGELRASIRDRVFYSPKPIGPHGKIAFVFPGSGNQFAGMGRDLSANWPSVLLKQQSENRRLWSQYRPDCFWADTIPAKTSAKQFLFGQVTLGTLTSDLLRSLGIRADALIGQSLGESAGLFGLRLWTDRDEMLKRIEESTLFGSDLGPPYNAARQAWGEPTGTAIDWVSGVLTVSAADVQAVLQPNKRAYLLIITTPQECVIGGERKDVEELVQRFRASFFPLAGVTLAHCEAGRPVEGPYRALHTLPVTLVPGLTVYSGARGIAYEPTPESAADSITAGLVGTIDYPAVIETAYRDGVRYFLEVGPGNSCTRMIGSILGDRPHLARAVTSPRQDSVSLVLRLVAALTVERAAVDLLALYGQPTHCFDHKDPPLERGPTLTVPVGQPTRARRVMPPHREPPATKYEPGIKPLRSNEPVRQASRPLTATPPPRAVRTEAAPIAAPVPPPTLVAEWSHALTPFVSACAETQTAVAEAHDLFLQIQQRFAQTSAEAMQLQFSLAHELFRTETQLAVDVSTPPPVSAVEPEIVPRSLSTEQCFEFARGKIGKVLGPLFAEVDRHPTRVRLPDGPLMLVDRILSIEGEPRSLTTGRVVTEHHVHKNRWYLDAGRIPTCVAVEAGQADLFLSGFLGIDFETKGLAVYRLIDAVVTFHRALPTIGDTIRYDIHIDQFIKQGDAWLFRFRFEAYVNGSEHLMSMKNGVAGFFTEEALAAGQGIVQTALQRQALPGKKPADWQPLVPVEATRLDHEQVEALRHGNLVAAFGPEFSQARLRKPAALPGGMLRLLDRVTTLEPDGGRFGIGFVRAEYDIHPDDWFLTCHFVDDMVMPGTLMFECCLHTLRVLLMRLGWVGEEGEFACEPVPGISSRLKCRGQVIASTRVVAYEVSIKEIGYGPEPYCIADALMFADGKPIVEIGDMSLRMAGLTRERLHTIWNHDSAMSAGHYDRKPALYDSAKILSYSNGKPSEAFGEPYRIFDRDRIIARLPGPPFQFLDRVTAVTGEPFVLKAGAACETQYDIPPDAWYFSANRCDRMPFSVLLEIALQPCGWLAAYCGSALTSETDLSFRNLGGKATQFRPVTPESGTLTVTVTMSNVSSSAGMIIQHYDMKVMDRDGVVYNGTTYFGFFGKAALENQVGMPQAKVPYLSAKQRAAVKPGLLPAEPPFPEPMLRMVDRVDGYLPDGGRAGLGLIQGSITVDPAFWFFQAHFYQDPVWPGSLGLESYLQLLKYVARERWGNPPAGWQTVALNAPHQWTYRGQVVPSDRTVTVVLEVTQVDDEAHTMKADGFLTVDGRVIYQMTDFTLEWA